MNSFQKSALRSALQAKPYLKTLLKTLLSMGGDVACLWPPVTFAPKRSHGSFTRKSKSLNPLASYGWQKDCAAKLRGVRLANVSAPCGAGKGRVLIEGRITEVSRNKESGTALGKW
jgi:hypothetical protein